MHSRGFFIFLGVLSLLLYLALWGLSLEFNWGEGYADRPILTYLVVYFTLFLLYVLACVVIHRSSPADRRLFWTVIVFGLMFRAAVFPAQQIQEDDVYRYLWDGKVFAHGINPFEYAPDEVHSAPFLRIRDPETFKQRYNDRQRRDLEMLNRLKWESETSLVYLERVNHPDVPTIYPPLAQFVFRAVHQVRPDSIAGMRVAFLLFDMIALIFIIGILEKIGKNPSLCLIYFWSPLIIKETFNSTHLDIIGISMLCASLYFLIGNRFTRSVFFLALSFLGKLYPVILLPMVFKQIALTTRNKKHYLLHLAGKAFLFVVIVVLCYLPFLQTGWSTFEGLRVYSTHWQSNDSIFSILMWFYGEVLGLGDRPDKVLGNDLPAFWSKATVAVALLGTVIWLFFRNRWNIESPGNLLRYAFILMALVFLLSPVQNPWYLCWVVPFLCFMPHRSWILLTGLVGLYYLDFYFDYQELQQYRKWIPWFEYVPFYLYLAWECWGKKIRQVGGPKPTD